MYEKFDVSVMFLFPEISLMVVLCNEIIHFNFLTVILIHNNVCLLVAF